MVECRYQRRVAVCIVHLQSQLVQRRVPNRQALGIIIAFLAIGSGRSRLRVSLSVAIGGFDLVAAIGVVEADDLGQGVLEPGRKPVAIDVKGGPKLPRILARRVRITPAELSFSVVGFLVYHFALVVIDKLPPALVQWRGA